MELFSFAYNPDSGRQYPGRRSLQCSWLMTLVRVLMLRWLQHILGSLFIQWLYQGRGLNRDCFEWWGSWFIQERPSMPYVYGWRRWRLQAGCNSLIEFSLFGVVVAILCSGFSHLLLDPSFYNSWSSFSCVCGS